LRIVARPDRFESHGASPDGIVAGRQAIDGVCEMSSGIDCTCVVHLPVMVDVEFDNRQFGLST